MASPKRAGRPVPRSRGSGLTSSGSPVGLLSTTFQHAIDSYRVVAGSVARANLSLVRVLALGEAL